MPLGHRVGSCTTKGTTVISGGQVPGGQVPDFFDAVEKLGEIVLPGTCPPGTCPGGTCPSGTRLSGTCQGVTCLLTSVGYVIFGLIWKWDYLTLC